MRAIDDYIEILIKEKGDSILYKGNIEQVLLVDATSHPIFHQDKVMYAQFLLETGDCIVFQDKVWLVTSEVNRNPHSYQARIRATNYRFKAVIDGELHELDSMIEGVSFGISTTSFVTIADGKMKVTLPSTVVTKRIKVGQRFIVMEQAWKVIGVDWSKKGLVELHVDKEQFNPNTDDVENGIANKDQIAIWDITIEDFNEQVMLGSEKIYKGQVLKNGTVVTNRKLCWVPNDETILSVKDGIVTPHKLGTATLTVWIEGNETVCKEFTIHVVDKAAPAITYKMWCIFPVEGIKYYDFFDILQGDTAQYSVEKYVDGILAEVNDTYTFTLEPGEVPADRYTFKIVNEQMCEMECIMPYTSKRLKLTATSNETGKTVEVLIELYRW